MQKRGLFRSADYSAGRAADMPKSTLLSRTVMGTGNATQHIAALVFIQGAVHD
jgi:hypothetical protein